MPRIMPAAWVALACLIVGCGKSGSGGVDPEASHFEALPTIQAASGGELVLIPAGSFTMGDSAGRPDETPHAVSVGTFYLDRFAVTQEIYQRAMGVNPSKRKAKQNPVESTQWTDAARFCNKCSELEGLTTCYDLSTWQCNFEADGYRLPTEAEWEYACRAGSTGKYCFGDAETELPRYAWLKPDSQGKPQTVGEKLPNHWGLFDMHGNVWAWCNDWYSESYYRDSPTENPRGPATGKMRVLRGGAWDSDPEKCRAAYRHKEFPVYSDTCFGADSYGFRRARSGQTGHRPGAVVAVPTSKSAAPVENKEKPSKVVAAVHGNAGIDLAHLRGTIVFVSDRRGTLKIWQMHANGKDARQLTHGDDPDAEPRFSPDGKWISYTSKRGGFPEVWMMKRDGSEPRFITKGSQASWAPDGKALVFIRDNEAYVRELASAQERRVTPPSWERCGVPAFSPDGRRLAVASRHEGNVGIYLLDLDGKQSAALKSEEACCTPRWSKDGRKILCQTVQGHVHQVGVDGKDWEQLTFGADVQHDACYSPDGTMILFCRAPAPEGPWQICVQKLSAEEDDFVTLTSEGSNLLPDWHAHE